ncbi:cytochrome P450 [Streptomyces sp. CA-250714]|uniref:cytochrome P450 n=1 Tax=Streptomyces sp. CA-250714 TaxID=3240060 RepID=UPI003D8DAF5B
MAGTAAHLQRDPHYDPLAPDVIAAPHTVYRRLREHRRVYWHAQLSSWVLTGYAECRQVLGDTDAFGSDFRRMGEDIPEALLSVQTLDPPAHGAIRHLLVSALHARSHTAITDTAARLVAERTAALRGVGRTVDLVGEFARPLALRTMCGFLGVTAPDGPWLEELSNAIVRSMDAGLDPSRAEPGNKAKAELSRMVSGWLETADEGGFIDAARTAHARAPQVPEAVLANSLRSVFHAGYESVSRLLSNALARLVAEPGLLAHAVAEDRLDALVDELLRLDGPVQAAARVCVADSEVGGERIRRGDEVILMLAAADRDPAVFADPDAVDLTRRKGLHLAFGRGAHSCLGAGVATLQLRAVLDALHAAGIVFEAAGLAEYEPTATLRGLRTLPVTVRATRPTR